MSVLSKITNLITHPVQTINGRRYRFMEQQAKEELEKIDSGCLAFLKARPEGAFMQPYGDLLLLYKEVRKRKPKVLLEFGSGCSTIVIAHALRRNFLDNEKDKGFLYSIDEEQRWAEVTLASRPKELEEFCDVDFAPLKEVNYGGLPVWEYDWRSDKLLKLKPDFIYLDGPELTPEREVAIDLLKLEKDFAENCFVLVDGRTKNVNFLEGHFKGKFKVTTNDFLHYSMFEFGQLAT